MKHKLTKHIGKISINNDLFDLIIWSLLYFYTFIDLINGSLERYGQFLGPISVAQIYKGFLVLVAFLRIYNTAGYKRMKVILTSIILYFIFICLVQNHPIVGNEYLADFIKLYKIIFIGLFFIYFYIFLTQKEDGQNYLKKAIYINFAFLVGNFMVGLMGYGFSTYSTGLGIKGFFYAGNELSILLLILSSFLIYKAYYQGFRYYLLSATGSLILALLLAMKTAILGVLLISFLIPFVQKAKTMGDVVDIVKKGVYSLVLILAGLTFIYLYLGEFYILGRWVHFFNEYGIITGLLSSRDLTLQKAIELFIEASSLLWMIFGIGFTEIEKTVGKLIEIDFFDIFFGYGLIGLIIVYGTWTGFILSLIKKMISSSWQFPYAKYAFLINIIIFLASFTTGHIVYSTSAGVFLAMVTARGFISKKGTIVYARKCIANK